MVREEENKIIINKIVELIYEMYLKDLRSGNLSISNNLVKSYGKIYRKKGLNNGYKNQTFFEFGK